MNDLMLVKTFLDLHVKMRNIKNMNCVCSGSSKNYKMVNWERK